MKNLGFWVKIVSFILTGYYVYTCNYTAAALWFMLYLGELAQSIGDVIENKE